MRYNKKKMYYLYLPIILKNFKINFVLNFLVSFIHIFCSCIIYLYIQEKILNCLCIICKYFDIVTNKIYIYFCLNNLHLKLIFAKAINNCIKMCILFPTLLFKPLQYHTGIVSNPLSDTNNTYPKIPAV